LLIKWKAEGDYVSALGWTPTFYILGSDTDPIFEETSAALPSSKSCDSLFLNLENEDPEGYTILKNIACHGSSNEIRSLLSLGAVLERGSIDL
jgi:hypothetical protein